MLSPDEHTTRTDGRPGIFNHVEAAGDVSEPTGKFTRRPQVHSSALGSVRNALFPLKERSVSTNGVNHTALLVQYHELNFVGSILSEHASALRSIWQFGGFRECPRGGGAKGTVLRAR
jgi:hypothetical protein